MKKIFIFGLLFVIILVSGCNTSSPEIELSTNSFDLGDIDPEQGKRVETFYVKNVGGSDLQILGVSTSCGCTEAEVENENIGPGEQSKLTVTYDPSVHPGLVGEIQRIVYIKSNDPLNPEVELELIGNSLATDENFEQNDNDHDKALLSDFEISPNELNNKIVGGEKIVLLDVREDFEHEENHIADSLLLSVNSISQSELEKLGLKKDDEVIVYCRTGRRSTNAYKILTELGYTNVKSLQGGLVHWMEDEYPVESGAIGENSKTNIEEI